MSNLATQLFRVRSGEIDFGEFVSNTQKEFRRMAVYLMKRWTAPEWFTADDVIQELYIGVWHYVWQWEESRGTTIDRYITFNVMHKAKRALHVARGVPISGRPDFEPSRFEKTVGSLIDGSALDGEKWMASILSNPPMAEENLIDQQDRKISVATALKMCETTSERYVVLAIREAGSIDDAAEVLYADIDHRIALRLDSEESAEKFVLQQAWKVAQRVSSRLDT